MMNTPYRGTINDDITLTKIFGGDILIYRCLIMTLGKNKPSHVIRLPLQRLLQTGR